MNTELIYIFEVLEKLRNNSGSNKKLEILRANVNNELLQKVFKYAYDKDYKYGITAARIVERPSLVYDAIAEENMFDVLDKLRNRELTGNAALEACTEYYNGSEWGPLFRLIINHDLNDGLGATTLKKVWPNMFSSFGVALAEVWDDKMRNKIDFENETWFSSRKLDGCVSGDTLITMADGSMKTIKELIESESHEKVLTYNINTNKLEKCEILNHLKNGVDIKENTHQWYEIELEDGRILKVTGNHRIFIPKLNCYRRVDELDGTEEFYVI